jgi:hypothetical protein
VQSQEFHGAKWGLAQRMIPVTDADIDRTFKDGRILRTHVMRPTWHFVAPADLRWLLSLTAPRVHQANAYYYRKFELDRSFFIHSNDAIARALAGGQQLTRNELLQILFDAGILSPDDDRVRMGLVLMRAELDGIMCSGALRGKQHTYALLDERVPPGPALSHDESLAELTRRYLTGHGPATVQDFAWWSGLLVSDVWRGIEILETGLVQEEIDGRTYWSFPAALEAPAPPDEPLAHLLWAYDEYTIAYKNHDAMLDPHLKQQVEIAFGMVVAINGRIAGGWKRTLQKGAVNVIVTPFREWAEAEQAAVAGAVRRFGQFLGLEAVLNLGKIPG